MTSIMCHFFPSSNLTVKAAITPETLPFKARVSDNKRIPTWLHFNISDFKNKEQHLIKWQFAKYYF